MKKLLIVAGTRPEIIKVAPVLLSCERDYGGRLAASFCLTGQHLQMANEAMSIFGLKPERNMEIMRPNQTLNQIAEAIFQRLPGVIGEIKPDVLVVQGDTTTASMAALCAFNMQVPVAHVEAGLRSYDLEAPYPEEMNRKLINSFARFNFAPTAHAKRNLLREAVPEERIVVTGNTIVDALMRIGSTYPLSDLTSVHPQVRPPFVLVTAHRRESFGEGIADICRALRDSALKNTDIQFIYPVHLNPNIKQPVNDLLANLPNVLLIEPLSYLGLLTLLKNCLFVITDSGGIQEEAPSFRKYCIVMRKVTERTESVEEGISELVGTDPAKILAAVEKAVRRGELSSNENPYGDGKASERILETLLNA